MPLYWYSDDVPAVGGATALEEVGEGGAGVVCGGVAVRVKVARASKSALTGLWVGLSGNVLIGFGLRVHGRGLDRWLHSKAGSPCGEGQKRRGGEADSLRECRQEAKAYSGCVGLAVATSQALHKYQLATERQGAHFLARRCMTSGVGRRSGVTLVSGLRF